MARSPNSRARAKISRSSASLAAARISAGAAGVPNPATLRHPGEVGQIRGLAVARAPPVEHGPGVRIAAFLEMQQGQESHRFDRGQALRDGRLEMAARLGEPPRLQLAPAEEPGGVRVRGTEAHRFAQALVGGFEVANRQRSDSPTEMFLEIARADRCRQQQQEAADEEPSEQPAGAREGSAARRRRRRPDANREGAQCREGEGGSGPQQP